MNVPFLNLQPTYEASRAAIDAALARVAARLARRQARHRWTARAPPAKL